MKNRSRTTQILSWVLAILLIVNLTTPAFAEGAKSDFVINDEGVLTEYTGSGGNVVIPDGVVEIGKAAFKDCTGLTGISLPGSVDWIADSAFQNCTGLKEIILPEALYHIGNCAFENCTSLISVTIPEGTANLWRAAFRGCTALEAVTFLGNTRIDNAAFEDCTSLTNVHLPESLWGIESDAFDGTPWLEKSNAKTPDFKIINGLLVEYTGSGGKVTIPDGVVRIDGGVFSFCENLTAVTIPDSVREIGQQAFYLCTSLEQLSLPEDVSGIQVIGEAFATDSVLNRAVRQKLYEMLRGQWVNLADCLEPQSEAIIQLSNQIAGTGTDYKKAKAICTWVSKNIKYDRDYQYNGKDREDVDLDPESILNSRTTICEGFARLTNALLQAQGIPALYVSGLAGPERNMRDWGGHAWSEAYVDGRWILIDTTWGTEYFDMKLPAFSLKHQGNARAYCETWDIPSDWAREEVWEAMTEGLIPAGLQGDYSGGIARGECCELLVSLVEHASGKSIGGYLEDRGLELPEAFPDTENTAVLAAAALGFASTQGNENFEPDRPVTRQEAAIMLARAAEELGLEADGDGRTFSDEENISSWAAGSVAFVTGLKDPISGTPVMDGMGDGKFQSKKYCTSEIVIVSVLRILHCVEDAQGAEQAA